MINGKTDVESNEYDALVFVRRDSIKITIPSFIKGIESYSFSDSSIEEISIPSHVTQICECAFSYCEQLQCIEIPSNSELQIIEKYAFSTNTV